MKKLESLNNSLFEKFENNKINNLAMCLSGGTIYNTQSSNAPKGDTFKTGSDNNTNDQSTMTLPDGKHTGDWTKNAAVAGGSGSGSGGGSAIGIV